jgi:hypothetical protein
METNNGIVASPTVSLDALLAKIAALEAQVAGNTKQQVSVTLPTGKLVDASCQPYLRWIKVPKIDPQTNKVVLETDPKSPYFGQAVAKGFRAQHCKEIILKWDTKAEVRFMKTEHSPKIHDSRMPQMAFDIEHVANTLKRVLGDDVKALKAAKWLNNVVPFSKVQGAKNYTPLKELKNFTPYFKVYGQKPKQPRQTVSKVKPSVPLSQMAADDIPF